MASGETYSTWDYYHNTFKGELSEETYNQYALSAKGAIDFYTYNRAADAPENMKGRLQQCECELLDAINAYSKVPAGISSTNNDGYSESFHANAQAEADMQYYQICCKYLTMPENLLYAGG